MTALGWAVTTLGWAVTVLGWAGTALGWAVTVLGWAGTVLGWAVTALGWALTALGWAVTAVCAALNGAGPRCAGLGHAGLGRAADRSLTRLQPSQAGGPRRRLAPDVGQWYRLEWPPAGQHRAGPDRAGRAEEPAATCRKCWRRPAGVITPGPVSVGRVCW